MKRIIFAFIAGLVVGSATTTWLFAMNEYGYFDSPYAISSEVLSSKIKKSEFDSHAEWFIEPYSESQVLVEYRLPLKREQFLVDRSFFAYLGPLNGRKKLPVRNGKLLEAPLPSSTK